MTLLRRLSQASDPELDIFNKWSVSFHGVKSKPVLKSILQQASKAFCSRTRVIVPCYSGGLSMTFQMLWPLAAVARLNEC